MSIDKYLESEIPFAVASGYFLSMKKFAEEMVPPPPMAGEAGPFAVPVEQVLQAMGAVAENEFKTMLAYRVYAESLRGVAREGIAEEFEEHADMELEHAEFILRRMAVLGGPIQLPDIQAPMPATEPEEIIQAMVAMEEAGIALWQELHGMVGEDPMKYEIEAFLVREQHHLDELMQLLPHSAPAQPVEPPAGAPPAGPPDVKVNVTPQEEAAPAGPPPAGEKMGMDADALRRRVMGAAAEPGRLKQFGQKASDVAGKLISGSSSPGHTVGDNMGHAANRMVAESSAASALAKQLQKTGSVEHVAPGTERYHSSRMLEVLNGLSPHIYTAEEAKIASPSEAVRALFDRVRSDVPARTIKTEGPEHEEKLASGRMKLALQEMMDAPMDPLPPQQQGQAGSQMGGLDPRTSAYLQNEQQGAAAEEQSAAAFYKQRFDEAQAQLQQATQSTQQLQAQADQLQQQAAMSQTAVTSAQQQAQQATSTAMQQISASGDNALKQQMEAAQMRQAYQQLRGQLMDIATVEPPASALQGQPESPPGATAPGQPGAQTTDPSNQGPAAQAPQAASQPGDVPPGGDQSQAGPQAASEPSEASGKGQGSTSVTVKQGGMNVPGAAIGGALGGIGGLEAGRHAEGLRGKVQQLEGEQGSFAKAMELAKNKALLAMSELSEEHPAGAAFMGSLMGAGVGHITQPAIQNIADSARRAVR